MHGGERSSLMRLIYFVYVGVQAVVTLGATHIAVAEIILIAIFICLIYLLLLLKISVIFII